MFNYSTMVAKGRHSRFPSRKSSTSTLVFSMLIIFSFLIFILLALGILSIPSTSQDSPKAHDLSSILHETVDRYACVESSFDSHNSVQYYCDLIRLCLIWGKFRSNEDDGGGDRWVEVISWEPRAFVYHNFLVSFLFWAFVVICSRKSCLN